MTSFDDTRMLLGNQYAENYVREVTARYIGPRRKSLTISGPGVAARFMRGLLRDEVREHFLALYARSNGLSERQQLKKDREEWPGGCILGFSLWITRKWSDWWKQHRRDREYLPKSVSNAILGDEEHKLFDEWLCENYRPKE